MDRKIILPIIALAAAFPLCVAMADDTASTGSTTANSTVDCGKAPAYPTGATSEQLKAFRDQNRQYFQCVRGNQKIMHGAIQGDRQSLKDQRQQLTQDRCANINQRINDRIDKFQSNQGNDNTTFNNIYQRLTNISTRLKADNLDTTKLNTDLTTLKTKIDKVSTDYASFIDALKATSTVTCGDSQGQFAAKLQAARTIMMTVRQDRIDVRTFITSTVRPDIMALRQQLAKTEGTSASTAAPTGVQ